MVVLEEDFEALHRLRTHLAALQLGICLRNRLFVNGAIKWPLETGSPINSAPRRDEIVR